MSGQSGEFDAGDSDLLKRFLSALDCCGTCAGGVLARYTREKQAVAWDEGAATPRMQDGSDEPVSENPYRVYLPAAPDAPTT